MRTRVTGVTRAAVGLTVLRVVVGIVFIAHGSLHLFVMKIPGVAGFFGQVGIPFPTLSAILVSVVEFAGGVALVLGLFTRVVAVPLGAVMVGAYLTVHMRGGFFLPRGYEYVLTLFGATVALALAGPGALSLDGLRSGRDREVRT